MLGPIIYAIGGVLVGILIGGIGLTILIAKSYWDGWK